MYKEKIMTKKVVVAFLAIALYGCASTPNMPQQAMSASYYDMKDESFSLQAIAPVKVIREYAICKAIWFAEKKKANKMALGDPSYGGQPRTPGTLGSAVPEGWGVVDATAYLSEPKSTQNPFVNVADMAANCRSGWEWYR